MGDRRGIGGVWGVHEGMWGDLEGPMGSWGTEGDVGEPAGCGGR